MATAKKTAADKKKMDDKKMGYNAAQELYRRVQANLTKNSEA